MAIQSLFNKYLYFILFLCFSIIFSLQAKESVLVSVAPHKFFVEKIAGNTLTVNLMVPAGSSAHTYEPKPRQMVAASQADIWFRIGESFETKAVPALQNHNPQLVIVDLRQNLDLISGDQAHHSCCHAHSMDLHFWLSPRMAQTQAQTIADALTRLYPEHQALYEANLKKFQQELKQLDHQIQTILHPLANRNILVSHPAYAYFCRDYDLKQFSIEFEGKDPTPQQLNKTLNLARDLNIQTIFIQMQYNNKGARLLADEIGAQVVMLDPYSENYFESLLEIAHAFAKG